MNQWTFPLIFLGGFLAWQFYRQFKKSGKVSKLILAQVSAFAAVYLLLDLLERRALVTGRVMDYISVGVVAVFVIVGSALTGAAVRKAEETKKRATTIGKKPVRQQPSKNKSKAATANKGTAKSKKKKG
jgi:hypothetical protein